MVAKARTGVLQRKRQQEISVREERVTVVLASRVVSRTMDGSETELPIKRRRAKRLDENRQENWIAESKRECSASGKSGWDGDELREKGHVEGLLDEQERGVSE